MFALAIVAILAVGIGGSTTIFAVVDAAILQPLPYRDPDRLVRIWESNPGDGQARAGVASGNLEDWRSRAAGFAGFARFFQEEARILVRNGDNLDLVYTAGAEPGLFSLLGVQPAFGVVGESPTVDGLQDVVLGENLWRRMFAADPEVLGRTIEIEGRRNYAIAAVMPAGFSFPGETELWLLARRPPGTERVARNQGVVGRLKDDVALAAARSELEAIAAASALEYPETNRGWTVWVDSLTESVRGGYRVAVLTPFAAVLMVLMVGCANIANLLLARGAARGRELSIRAALGAGRIRLTRLLLCETLVLSLAGGAAGLVLARSILPLLKRQFSSDVPLLSNAELGMSEFAFCAGLSLAATLTAGLLPALRATRIDPQPSIQAGRPRSNSLGPVRLQQFFTSAQIAVSVVLTVGALMLAQSFVGLYRIDVGFEADEVVAVNTRFPIFGDSALERWYLLGNRSEDVLARLRSMPGVESAAISSDLPLRPPALPGAAAMPRSGVSATDFEDADSWRPARERVVSADYFRTMGIPLLRGRDFTSQDRLTEQEHRREAPPRDGVAIVNQTLAEQFWPGEDAMGQYLSSVYDRAILPRRRVVGIVADTVSTNVGADPVAEFYVPFQEEPTFAFTVLVRSASPVDEIGPRIRADLAGVDPDLYATEIVSLEQIVNDALGAPRILGIVMGGFACVALLLCGIGFYGVLGFGVVDRRGEIGIRRALGAESADIVRLFLRQSFAALSVGLVAGVAGAWALARAMGSLLYGVTPSDWPTFLTATVILAFATVTAGALPLRRALRMQPSESLRQ